MTSRLTIESIQLALLLVQLRNILIIQRRDVNACERKALRSALSHVLDERPSRLVAHQADRAGRSACPPLGRCGLLVTHIEVCGAHALF